MNIVMFRVLATFSVFGLGCQSQHALSAGATPSPSPPMKASPTPNPTQTLARSLFRPLAQPVLARPELVDLGRMLYYDTRLSRSGTISCNSCHSLSHYGVDNRRTSVGDRGQHGGRNSPTVYHAFLHVAQFWDGRAKDVEAQAKGPMLNPVEMAMAGPEAVVQSLQAVPVYRQRFAAAFPKQKNPLNLENVAVSIGAFERGLVTPSRFDRFLEGEADALSFGEQEGLKTFVQVGCASCHSGVGLGGDQYQKLGVRNAYATQDTGRFQVTKDAHDRGVFKVPSLRNIARTGPYFHDGSVADLEEAIRLMGHHQLGVELTAEEIQKIKDFLASAEGQIPQDYIRAPEIPPTEGP